LIKDVVALYFYEGNKVADVTFGKGVFWKDVDQSKFDIVGTDLKQGVDFRHLPYPDKSFDHSVIDPPYARIKNLKCMQDCYHTARDIRHTEIIQLYNDGLNELTRITKKGGFILCKCQDEIYGCKQKWSHIEIFDIAKCLGLYPKDLFILVNTKRPKPVYKQQHARKNHSYLWVFQV
jgi:tRNA G10  N-methylase Trm11